MVIRKWIEGYGHQLHEFANSNEKYKHLLEADDFKINIKNARTNKS